MKMRIKNRINIMIRIRLKLRKDNKKEKIDDSIKFKFQKFDEKDTSFI